MKKSSKMLIVCILMGSAGVGASASAFNETTRAILALQSSLPYRFKCNESRLTARVEFQNEDSHRYGLVEIRSADGKSVACRLDDASPDRVSVYANHTVSRVEVSVQSATEGKTVCQIAVNAFGVVVIDSLTGRQATCTSNSLVDQ